MMNFAKLRKLEIPEGQVIRIDEKLTNILLWKREFGYVSFGDSIAAGHTIDENWDRDYGTRSQYGGEDGNPSTVLVPGCYTDLIHKELVKEHGEGRVVTTSFARSGDTVEDLMNKLTHDVVKDTLRKANLVTVCIGANDILGAVSEDRIMDYLFAGNLAEIEAEVETNLNILNDDNHPYSYMSLLKELHKINPNAQYAFTVVYNPYKYLWIAEGNDGFFKPLLDTIPDITILGFDIDNILKDQLLSTDMVDQVTKRINVLSEWVESRILRLDQIIKNKIGRFSENVNPNFMVAETKELFEVFPDRPYSASKHYNDLISVEFTKGFDIYTVDWGKLYEGTGKSAFNYWVDAVTPHVSLSGIDFAGIFMGIMPDLMQYVIMPDMDPHPETYGQYVLSRSFEDVIGIKSLDRHTITFNANGGSGIMGNQIVVGVDGLPAFTNIQPNAYFPGVEGYYYNGWNTAANGGGTSYGNKHYISLASNLALYAQWSNIYKIYYRHVNKTTIYTDDETGHKECYALWIDGTEQADFGKFSEGVERVIPVQYGKRVGVIVSGYNPTELTYDDADTDVYWNGVSVAQGYGDNPAIYEFTLTGDVTIEFQWKVAGSLVTFDAKSWEDCYITTHESTDTIKEMVLDSGVLDSAILG